MCWFKGKIKHDMFLHHGEADWEVFDGEFNGEIEEGEGCRNDKEKDLVDTPTFAQITFEAYHSCLESWPQKRRRSL